MLQSPAMLIWACVAIAMQTLLDVSAVVQADTVVSFGSGINQFDIDFVTIGNPGNAADTTGDPIPAGSVGYVYQIGKYEVSRMMVEKANEQGDLGISLYNMGFVTGGARADMPATGLSWNMTARFVNWLNVSQGFSPAYKFATQPGASGYDPDINIELWQPGDLGYNADNPFRNQLAKYFLPSVDEWYKAAFYDPNANGGIGGYWNYATRSDDVPTPISGGIGGVTAVWSLPYDQGPADITQAGGLSAYGTMAQGGNVVELEEKYGFPNENGSSNRGLRGGWWYLNQLESYELSSSYRGHVGPHYGSYFFGFRVASVPEPGTSIVAMLCALELLRRRPITDGRL